MYTMHANCGMIMHCKLKGDNYESCKKVSKTDSGF